jgi:hypothetical protein
MSNSCGFSAGSYQDLADLLCLVQTNILAQTTYISGQVGSVQGTASDTDTRVAIMSGNLNGLRDWIGDPSGGPTVYAQIATAIADILDVQTTANDILTNGASQNVSIAEINSDVDEANDALGVAGVGKTDIIDAVQQSGVLSVVVGLIDFAKTGGGTLQLALVQWLISLWNSPPLALLTASSTHLLSQTNSITISTGTYGYVLNLTVPGYWGQRSSTPVLYQPAIGYCAWRGPFGTVGDPITILTPQMQLYPVPTGATVLDVQLETGIVANYSELRFL